MPNRPVSDPKRCLFATQNELAHFLEVSPRAIRQWIAVGCPGRREDGLYDGQAMESWRYSPDRPSLDDGWRWRGHRYRG